MLGIWEMREYKDTRWFDVALGWVMMMPARESNAHLMG
jgi:hypothetical protein